MSQTAPKSPEIPTTKSYFNAYVHAPGDTGLTQYKIHEEFAAAMADTSAQGLVVYAPPAHVLAHLMQDGATPAAARDLWEAQAAPYLALLRKTRRRLALFQVPRKNAPAEVQAVIQKRMPKVIAFALPDLPAVPELTEPFWQALAHLYIRHDPQISDMIDIVQSHSTGEVDPLQMDDIASVIRNRWVARDVQISKQYQKFVAQDGMLVGQVLRLEQGLAEKATEFETRVSAFEAEAAKQESKAAELENKAAALEAETAKLMLADKHHREMMAQMTTQIGQLEKALQFSQSSDSDIESTAKRALRQMVRQLETSLSMSQSRQTKTTQALRLAEAELAAVQASTSWRATKPMRSVSQIIRK